MNLVRLHHHCPRCGAHDRRLRRDEVCVPCALGIAYAGVRARYAHLEDTVA
jgi:hypothetical protein